MKQHKRTWQRHEARVAAALGVQRTGNQGGATPDAANSWLAVECKSWTRLPAQVVKAMEQAESSAGEGQLPIVVLHQVRQKQATDLVVMRWSSFVDWFGGDLTDGEQAAGEGAE